MYHETLDVRNVCKDGKQTETVDELPGCLLTALDFEGEDGTSAVREILPVEFMVRMIPQGRMVDLLNKRGGTSLP